MRSLAKEISAAPFLIYSDSLVLKPVTVRFQRNKKLLLFLAGFSNMNPVGWQINRQPHRFHDGIIISSQAIAKILAAICLHDLGLDFVTDGFLQGYVIVFPIVAFS